MENSSQHWVPRSYLEAWCDPDVPSGHDPFVWLRPKTGGPARRKSPKKIFKEADFYTIHLPDGARDLALEHGLDTIENNFCRIREKRIEQRVALSADEKVWLCAFIAAIHIRTKPQRAALQQQWGHVLRVAEGLQAGLDRMTPEESKKYRPPTVLGKSTGPSLSVGQVKQIAAKPIQHMLLSVVEQDLPILNRMNLTIFTTDYDPGFITSDFPCIWFDPANGRRPTMLRSESIEVTMPISPRSLALLSWQDFPLYQQASVGALDNANRTQQIACEEYLIVKRNLVKSEWFA
jgi:hypothetical protein